MRQHDDELRALGVRGVLVTFQAGPVVENYIRETRLDWPVLIDESKALYRAYGMERGRAARLVGPATWWVYLKLMCKGRRPRAPSGDVRQLGGDVLIDPTGIVRLQHASINPADRPAVSDVLDVVRRAQ